MTDQNCDTCENYKEKQPAIRPFTQAEFDRAKADNETWKRVLCKVDATDKWETATQCGTKLWLGNRDYDCYGLPCTDPFWTAKRRGCKDYYVHLSNGKTWAAEADQLSLVAPPLVKVWAIDKTGDVIKYSFRGQPNWKRIKWENKDAEAIVVTSDRSVDVPRTICKLNPNESYVIFRDKDCLGYNANNRGDYNYSWFAGNPVPALRAAIIERNKVTFKVGDWFIDSAGLPRQVTETNLVYVKRHADKLRRPSCADFIRKINGHEWLAVESSVGINIYRDGKFCFPVYAEDSREIFHTFIKLPVCPAGIAKEKG